MNNNVDMDRYADGVIAAIDFACAPLAARIRALEARLGEVEARGLEYAGIHQKAVDYRRGTVTTHDGSAWVAIRDAEAGEIPGQSAAWQLAVKKGRDGRNAT